MRLYLLLILISLTMAQKCPSGDKLCLSCSGTRCTQCIFSFINSKGICQKPTSTIPNCMYYEKEGACSFCDSGFVAVSGKCIKNSFPKCKYSTT